MALIMEYESSLLPQGEYEMVIKSAYEDVTKGGTQYIRIPMVVRNDVEQPYQNAYLWHAVWRAKNPTPQDNAFGGYLSRQILRLCEMAGIPKGTKFESLTDLLDALKNKPLRAGVQHETYQGQTSARLQYTQPTKAPDCRHKWKSPAGEIQETVDEEDLPFDV